MTFAWPEDMTLLGGIAMVKALDADGEVVYVERSFGDLLIPELLGMGRRRRPATAHRVLARSRMTRWLWLRLGRMAHAGERALGALAFWINDRHLTERDRKP